jgi:hypothetical protein
LGAFRIVTLEACVRNFSLFMECSLGEADKRVTSSVTFNPARWRKKLMRSNRWMDVLWLANIPHDLKVSTQTDAAIMISEEAHPEKDTDIGKDCIRGLIRG